MEANFDSILFRTYGPYSDLRLMRDGAVVAELRMLGDMPDEELLIAKLYRLFSYVPMTICNQDWTKYKLKLLPDEAAEPEEPSDGDEYRAAHEPGLRREARKITEEAR